ncbi:MAG: hypothetical protein KAV87_35340, partial [Desulfobacteraceae bacterium]|nr:hypothetical protein [Desulfobacteraceae bacterium]
MKKFILLIPVVFMFILSQVGLANAVTVRLDPSTVNLTTTGATFGINVRVDDVTNLGGFQFDIGYTPAIVTVENTSDVTLGSFLGSTGRTVTAVGPSIDNTAGKVTFGAFSFGAAAGPDGSGLLATIKFTVQSQTAGTLDLNNVILTDTSANPITVDVIGDTTLTVTTAPAVTLNPTSLAFGDQDVGTTTSTAQTVTLTNSGNATLNITSIT